MKSFGEGAEPELEFSIVGRGTPIFQNFRSQRLRGRKIPLFSTFFANIRRGEKSIALPSPP